MEELSQEQIQALIDSLGPLPDAFRDLTNEIKNATGGVSKLGTSSEGAANTVKGLSTAAKDANESIEREANARDDNTQRSKAAYNQSIAALNSLGDALTSANPSFADLGGVATASGKALGNLAENALPAFGSEINTAIQMLGEFSAAFLQQFAEQNSFGAQMRKMGVSVAEMSDGTINTTDSLSDLARDAGYSSESLGKLGGLMTSSSEAIALLGTNSTDGARAFLEYSNISLAEQKRMSRLGYTIEELNEVQTGYIELQRASGINLKAQNVTGEVLQKRSLDYAKSLTAISEITGRSAQEQMKAADAQRAEYRNKIASLNQQREIQALLKEEKEARDLGNDALANEKKARAKMMQDELDSRTMISDTLSRILGKDLAEQINTVMITGNFDETTTAIAQLGLNAGDLATAFEGVDPDKPEEVMKATQNILDKVINGQEDGLARFGDALIRMGADAEGFGKSVGISAENIAQYQQLMGEGKKEDAEKILMEAVKQAGVTAKKGQDDQQDTQATFGVIGRVMRTAADGLMDFGGPLVLGLTAGAVVALGVAATKAALSLNLLGGGAGKGGLVKKTANLVKGGFAKANASKFLKIGGGVVAGGLMAAQAFSDGGEERLETADNLAEEKIDKAEADRRDTATNYETGGEMGGAMAGALTGAAFGAALGPVGALIGAGLGAWIGAKGGSEIGEAIGASAGAKLEKDVKKANLALAEQSGFYDKKGAFKDSTVDFDKVTAAQKDKTLTQNVLQSMLEDNDMNDEDEQRVYDILKQMKEANEGLETEKTVADANQAEAEKEVADEEKLIVDLGLDGDTNAEIDNAIVEVEKELVTKTDLLKDAVVSGIESEARLIAATTALAEVTQPMNEATREFLAWANSDEGKAEIAQKEAERAAGIAEMNTLAENQMLSKEDQYREIVDTGQYKGKDATESQLGQAQKYLESIEETKRMAMAQDGQYIGTPTVDISPEPDAQASAEGASTEKLAMLGKSDEVMSYAEKQLILTEQQNILLGQLISKQEESNDLSEKQVQMLGA